VTRGPECGKLRIYVGRSRCQKKDSGDSNRLRTLVCVCQWSVKCSSEWYVQVVNKSIHQSVSHLQSQPLNHDSNITFPTLMMSHWQDRTYFIMSVTRSQTNTVKLISLICTHKKNCLFTNVPVDESLKVIRNKFHNDDTLAEWSVLQVKAIMELLEVCLRTTYYQVDDKFFQQKDGMT
jgi:hypothetical protein